MGYVWAMGIIGRLWNLGKGTWKVRQNDSPERVSDAELEAELEGMRPGVKAQPVKDAPQETEASAPEPEKDESGKVIKTL